jgi:hypothetical protein
MFWWIVILGTVVLVGAIIVVESRRGSTGESAKDDRHLNRRDPRGGGGEWKAP